MVKDLLIGLDRVSRSHSSRIAMACRGHWRTDFLDLLLVVGRHLVLQHVQVVLVVQIEHLGDDAHAHPVALAQAEVDLDLLGHVLRRAALIATFTGTW